MMMNDHQGAFSVKEFLSWARISRTKFYEEVGARRIEVRKLGKKTLVPRQEAERWLDSLPTSKH